MTGVVEIFFVGLLLAVAVLALLPANCTSLSILFVIGGLVLGLNPKLRKVRSIRNCFPVLPATAPFSGGAVYVVARFPRETFAPSRYSPSASFLFTTVAAPCSRTIS